MYKLFKVLTNVTACIILLLSLPIFIAYGVSEASTRALKWSIDCISENILSKWLIKKTQEHSKKEEKAEETEEN